MAVLVTGGAGYIGSHMVLELVDAGERVVVIDDLSTGFAWVLPPSVPLIVGNAGDQVLVGRAIREHGIEEIIHFAALSVVPDSIRDPLSYYRNNADNSRSLIECAVNGNVRHFIFSSTAAVYGDQAEFLVKESAPTLPISPYGWSKLMTEVMLHDVGRAHDLRYAILRYFNVAGADPHRRTGQSTASATHLMKVAIETALGLHPKFRVFGNDYLTPDGTCIRDYIHVSDLVRAHSDVLHQLRSGAPSSTFNCGYGHGFSVLEVIEAIKSASGVDFEVCFAPRRFGDPARVVADSGQIREVLGWRPRFDDLSMIVSHALAREHELTMRRTKTLGEIGELKRRRVVT